MRDRLKQNYLLASLAETASNNLHRTSTVFIRCQWSWVQSAQSIHENVRVCTSSRAVTTARLCFQTNLLRVRGRAPDFVAHLITPRSACVPVGVRPTLPEEPRFPLLVYRRRPFVCFGLLFKTVKVDLHIKKTPALWSGVVAERTSQKRTGAVV